MEAKDFDPNGIGIANGNYFGLPFTPEESRLVLISVPWDVTTSYGGGASFAPDAMIEASMQVDLLEPLNPGGWREGIGTVGIDYSIQDRSAFLRPDARRVIDYLASGAENINDHMRRKIARINEGSATLNDEVYESSKSWLDKGKLVGLVGGDHSTPLGHIRAVAQHEGAVGILHLDAHADLRESYEGFESSHASIMYNVMTGIPEVTALVQVGLRDMCDEELQFAAGDRRIKQFTDFQLGESVFEGKTWKSICENICSQLPEKVYISFDIDALSPDLCPNTGTPVAGGLSFREAVYLIYIVVQSGRRIVGFDLCEVSPSHSSEWDANVGARMLYKLCNLTLKSNG